MARYDWVRGYDRGFGPRRTRGGYASDFGSWGDAWGSAGGGSGFWGRGVGLYRGWGTPWEGRGYGGGSGYDRGVYGGSYPQYGGYPGGGQRGMHYGGGRGPAYDAGYGRGGSRGYDYGGGYPGGYGGGYGGARGGYDRSFARTPFVPEEAYRRHPELDREQEHLHGRWPEQGDEGAFGPLDDEEIRRAVRQNLYQDNWIDPDRVQVEVNDGVVTLTGEVDDFMQARYAWDDAWESTGVRGVINNLHVRVDQDRDQHGDPLPQEE